jgi:hypothetical protein
MRATNPAALVLLALLLTSAAEAADPAAAEPAAKPAAAEAPKPAPATAPATAKPTAPDAGGSTAPDASAPGDALTPEERIRRATVSAPGKECEVPDETEAEKARLRARMRGPLETVTADTIVAASSIANAYWQEAEKRIFAETKAVAQAWNFGPESLVALETPLSDGLSGSLIRTCRIAAADEPARCWDYGRDQTAFSCYAWASVWKASSQAKSCAGVEEELVPLCKMAISGKRVDCDSASARVQMVCRFIDSAQREDWTRCDDPTLWADCLSLLFARSTQLGPAACDLLVAGQADNSPRRPLHKLCKASMSGDPKQCPDEEWERVSAPARQRVVRADVMGGATGPHLYVTAAATTPLVCHVGVTIRSAGVVEQLPVILDIGWPARDFTPIKLPVTIDAFEAKAELDTVCAPRAAW